ncbi:hypothetical protein LCGC14_1047080 [marine sediment metagenome]|uniref:ABC transmembrane type-2 domain-containing protein n=1 Tax=marine sediment metagenome TaxID=412755 RepID=A0A0F9MQ03_9ZZZZ
MKTVPPPASHISAGHRARTGLVAVSWRTARTVIALMLREMGSTYGRSPGGYVWALLEPVGAILILALAFSLMLRAPSLGTSFILFYATGFLPFNVYSDIATKVGGALGYSKPLLAYPGVTWVDAVMARFLLNSLTGLTVFCLLITSILIVVDAHTVIALGPILTGLSMAALLGLGVGLLNSVLKGLYPVWGRIWGIINRPLFLASGVFFTYEDMPPRAQEILIWNPLLHVVGLVRRGFYPTYQASYVSLTYGFGVAMIMVMLGMIFMRAHYKTVLER